LTKSEAADFKYRLAEKVAWLMQTCRYEQHHGLQRLLHEFADKYPKKSEPALFAVHFQLSRALFVIYYYAH
jgi:hypothetical protein